MTKTEKRILDGLAEAKVGEDLVRRTRGLIKWAGDFDEERERARELEAAARYVCGAAKKAPALSQELLEAHGDELFAGLSEGRTLDAWDLRALDLLARVACRRDTLEAWVFRRIARFPDQPILEETTALLRPRGVWRTDKAVLHSLMGRNAPYWTADRTLTSAGRWVLELIDRDAAAVLQAARSWRIGREKIDRRWILYALLAAHRREVFDQLCVGAPPEQEYARTCLAAAMLETDRQHYEDAAVKLLAGLTVPIPAARAALLLERHLPGKHRELFRPLLLAAIRSEHQTFRDDDGEKHDTHVVAVRVAAAELGEGAAELWDAYHEENDALRLGFYELIEEHAHEKALPWLVQGLVYPKDPKVEYGFVSHAKYVARLARLVRKYDFARYRGRIQLAFAATTNTQIRQEIDVLLGKRPAADPDKKATFDPKNGYAFDVYGAALVKAALAAVKEEAAQLPSPIEEVKLACRDDGELLPSCLLLEGGGESAELELAPLRTKIPSHVDFCDEEDRVLPRFAKLHGLRRGDEGPSWGDDYRLPACVLIHEHIAAAQAILAGMRELGLVLAEGCRAGVGGHDGFEEDLEAYARRARDEVSALPEDQQADFAAVCFVDPARQAWLRGLHAGLEVGPS